MRYETIISNSDELADKRVRLNFGPLTDDGATLDLDKGPNEAIISDCATVKVYGFDDGDAVAKGDINNPCLTNCGFCDCVFHNEEDDPF